MNNSLGEMIRQIRLDLCRDLLTINPYMNVIFQKTLKEKNISQYKHFYNIKSPL